MSPLVDYVKKGLKNCYMPQQRCWSYIYHLDGRQQPNESNPYYDAFYSLNVVLGFAALGRSAWEQDYDLPAILQEQARRLFEISTPTYAIGMALWAAAELDVELEPTTQQKVDAFVNDRAHWAKFRAQDAGMILSGMCAQKQRGNTRYDSLAQDLSAFIIANYLAPSGLFYDETSGLRRNFSSFATHTYLTTALYRYGLCFGDDECLRLADTASRKLIALQGPKGEWPWFYFAPKGIVVDNYEVYAVHQDGMAALFLTFAENRGIPGAREASIKGFNWVFGQNQLGRSMMVPDKGMFIRSIIRKGELNNKKKRMIRAVKNALLGRSDPYASPEYLDLRLECRSYHLGWVLYSYGTRKDMPEITHNAHFTTAQEVGIAA